MRKLICALLALAVCLSLAACNVAPQDNTAAAPDTETTAENTTAAAEETTAAQETEDSNAFDPKAAEPVIGQWSAKASVDTAALSLEGVQGAVSVPMILIFDDLGVYSVSLDVEAFSSTVDAMYLQVLMDAQYAQLAREGMEKEAADVWVQEAYGTTMEDYVRSTAVPVDYSSILAELTVSGSYRVEGDKLYLDEDSGEAETIVFQADEDTLTLKETDRQARWKKLGVRFALKLTSTDG